MPLCPMPVTVEGYSLDFSSNHSIIFVQQCFQNSAEIPLSLDHILGVDDIRDVVNGVGMV